jgi:hypothetical protein
MRITIAVVVLSASSTLASAETLGGLIFRGAVKAAVGSTAAKAAVPKVAPKAVTNAEAVKEGLKYHNARQTSACLYDRRLPDTHAVVVKHCDMSREARKKKAF